MTEPQFNVEKFYGSVNLVDWMSCPDGSTCIVLTGWVSIFEASKMVGFNIKHDPTANWVARIEGPTQSYNIPGCKVRAVVTHDESVKPLRDGASRVLVVP